MESIDHAGIGEKNITKVVYFVTPFIIRCRCYSVDNAMLTTRVLSLSAIRSNVMMTSVTTRYIFIEMKNI